MVFHHHDWGAREVHCYVLLYHFYKKACQDFDQGYIESIDHFGENWHLNIESSGISGPLIRPSLIFGSEHYTFFVKFIPVCFLLFDVTVIGSFFNFVFQFSPLLICRNAADFCILTLHSLSMLHTFISLSCF